MKIVTGIASTTHVDRHFERNAKSALDGMAQQIKAKYIPYLIEHDPDRQIGVMLYGEVFQLGDGEFALGVVTGQFETPKERNLFINGAENTVWPLYKKQLNVHALIEMQAKIPKDPNESNRQRSDIGLSELLDIHLSSTQVTPGGQVYKIKKYVATTGDLRIEVYPKDHEQQPHFHVISKQRGINARFDLKTLQLINLKTGKIKPKDIKKIQNFFSSKPMFEKLLRDHAQLN